MKNTLISVIVSALVALAIFALIGKHNESAPAEAGHDIVMERVERSGEIRCGYVNNPPYVSLDPNTHEVSGLMVDIAAKMAEATNWKIRWAVETTYSTMAQDMEQGKFDVFCGGSWPIPLSEKRQWWLGPLFYSGVEAFARNDDNRFGPDFKLKDLNDPAYSISVIDGVAVDRVRAMDFSHAKVVALPALSNYSEMILQVVGNKADVVLIEKETASRYMATNPGKIKHIGEDRPIRYYGIGYEFPYNAPRLRNVFEAAMRELVDGGVIDHILSQYEVTPGMFYRVRPVAGDTH